MQIKMNQKVWWHFFKLFQYDFYENLPEDRPQISAFLKGCSSNNHDEKNQNTTVIFEQTHNQIFILKMEKKCATKLF